MIRLVTFFFLSLPFFVEAAFLSASTCDYYLQKEKETGCYVKSENPSDYLINFGYRLCNIYHQKAEIWNDERSEFIRKVALCLQNELEKINFSGDCRDLEEKAFAVHPYCYKQTGYCQLSTYQKTTIIWTALAGDVLNRTTNPFVSGLQLLKDCR